MRVTLAISATGLKFPYFLLSIGQIHIHYHRVSCVEGVRIEAKVELQIIAHQIGVCQNGEVLQVVVTSIYVVYIVGGCPIPPKVYAKAAIAKDAIALNGNVLGGSAVVSANANPTAVAVSDNVALAYPCATNGVVLAGDDRNAIRVAGAAIAQCPCSRAIHPNPIPLNDIVG